MNRKGYFFKLDQLSSPIPAALQTPSFCTRDTLEINCNTKISFLSHKAKAKTIRHESIMATHGFQGAGGGGGVGNIGGTEENIVFLSIFVVLSPDRATSAATRPAFPARVGSV